MDDQKYIEDVINRYVYQVTRRLNASQREDIEKELRGLIDDMLMERSENPKKDDIDAVLIQLGKPSELANKYKDTKQYLIGPEYFEFYIFILKIVMGATAFGIILSMAISYAVTPPGNIVDGIAEFISSVFMGLFQAFAWVTVGFAVADRYSKKKVLKFDEKWKPADLPQVPVEKATIKRSEPIAGIVMTLLVMIAFNLAPQIISIYLAEGDTLHTITLFNMENWSQSIVFFNALFAIGLVKEFTRLLIGKHNLQLGVLIAALNIVSLAIFIPLFTSPMLWNPDFGQTLQGLVNDFNFVNFFEIMKQVIVWLVLIGTVVDSIKVLYLGIRYSVTNKKLY